MVLAGKLAHQIHPIVITIVFGPYSILTQRQGWGRDANTAFKIYSYVNFQRLQFHQITYMHTY